MKNKANWIAAGAFVVGCVGLQAYVSKLKNELRGGAPESVLVVTHDLSPGDTLSDKNVGALEVPADYLDARRVRASERENLLGVRINQPIQAGEALLWSDIDDGAAHKHLAALVTPGRRAYSLESGANPLGRLLRVADRVDVLVETNGKSETLLEHVLVLAVGGQIERDDDILGARSVGGSGVTLSVTTEQANQLLAAEARGELHLVLRNPEDEKTTPPKEEPSPRMASKSSAAHADEKETVIEHVR